MQNIRKKNCSPSYTNYIKFGFNSITHDIALAFAKLVCKTNPDGSLVVNSNGHYIRDDKKIMVITDWYLRSIGHISEAYKLVQRFEQEYTVLLKDKYPNLVIKNSEEHRWLLDTKGLQNDLASKINPNDAPEGWAEVYNEFMKGLIKNLDKASGQQLLQPMEHGGYQQPYSYPAGSPYPNAAGSSYLGSNLLQTNATTQSNQTTHGANLNGGSSNGGLGM